jgi:hypothetical protein
MVSAADQWQEQAEGEENRWPRPTCGFGVAVRLLKDLLAFVFIHLEDCRREPL